ncbi:MAG: UvrD-helicase domain-containing protein [Endomicrobiales bacterium]|nr:UvrD-helicase domain-containing protein [Endomicrobiales bacterium]
MSQETIIKSDTTQDILVDLNTYQKQAVRHDKGPLLIIAGAGTGKTSVITRRIAYLIATKKARPSEILALTFTDKAATEMEERVDILVPYGFNDVWLSTFHAFGDRILRENAFEIGLSPDYHLLTQAEAAVFFYENLFNFQLKHYRPLGNPTQFIRAMINVFSRAKDEDIKPDDYLFCAQKALKKAVSPKETEEAEKQIEVANAYKTYEELKRRNNYLDFGDQVVLALDLLRQKPAILEKYQKKFKYILVDEFQDTNYAQFELVKLLSATHKNITVVGDDDQSIYKFRGACLSNILGFKEVYPDCREIVLRENYRSTQIILNSAYKLIKHNNPERLEVRNNINKELESSRLKGEDVKHLHFDTLSTETDELSKIIKEKVSSGRYSWRDIAILVRSNDSVIPFLKSLNMLDIPWSFSGNQGLYKREEIRLLLAFLRLMANPNDSVSLHYLALSQLYEFDPVDLSLINHVASYYKRSLFDVMKTAVTNAKKYSELENMSDETISGIKKLLNDLNEYYRIAQKARTGELLYLFLKKTRILDRLYNSTSFKDAEEAQNIAKFFRIIDNFGKVAKYDRVNGFVEHIDSLLALGDDPSIAEPEFDIDAVNVLTYHKAKGLEFPVVFMVSLVEDRFPSRNKKEPIELPTELIKDVLPTGDYHVQEERRLFYVGMTRAKDELYFTSARDYGGKRAKKISRFVIEALDKPQADESFYKSGIKEKLERFAPCDTKSELRLILPGKKGVLKLSPYAIDDYLTCPLKYKYVHVMRVPILRHHTLVFGEVIHRVLREYYRAKKENKKFGTEDLIKIYKMFWSSAGFLSREHEEERFRNGREILLKYFRQQEKIGIIPLSVEEDFKFLLGKDIRVVGRWDRLDERLNAKSVAKKSGKKEQSGERVIVDFKTTTRIKDQKTADREIKQSIQLIIYALGHKMKYGKLPDSLELHFLESNIVASFKPTSEMIEDIKDKIVTVAAGIKQMRFSARPTYMACQYCAYSNICPAQRTN